MTKPTLQDKIGAIENIQLLIREFMEVSAHYEKDSVVAEMRRLSDRLERRKQNLIHPKPRKVVIKAKPPATSNGLQIAGVTTARYVVEKHPSEDKWHIHDTSKGQYGYTNRYYTFEAEAQDDCSRLNAQSAATSNGLQIAGVTTARKERRGRNG